MTETPPPAPQAVVPLSDSDARMYATIAHAGNILVPAVAPLIMWLIGKDKSTFVDTEGKEALNFGILAAIVYIVSSVLMFILIGFLTWAAAGATLSWSAVNTSVERKLGSQRCS